VQKKKIRLKEIFLEKLEGEPAKTIVYTFFGADSILYNWSQKAPEIGYDKTRVSLEYENGDVLTFRYDLRRNNNPPLSEFIKDQLEFIAGIKIPERCNKEFLKMYTEKDAQTAKNILANYQLNDSPLTKSY